MKNKSNNNAKRSQNERQYEPRRPDYSGKKVAIWVNERDGRKWLRVKIEGINEKFVAFENKGAMKDGKQ